MKSHSFRHSVTRLWGGLLITALVGCSFLNREGPEVTCQDLAGGLNACRDGILASCVDGDVVYRVCDEKSVCERSWQTPGAFTCSEGEEPSSVNTRPGSVTGRVDAGPFTSEPDGSQTCTTASTCISIERTSIVSDTNTDGVLSPGETGSLEIELKNSGMNEVADLRGDLTGPADVTIVGGSGLRFGALEGNSTACGVSGAGPTGYCSGSASYAPSIAVPATAVVGSVMPFSLNLRDVSGNAFTKTFFITVGAIDQSLAINATRIVADTNGDSMVSPGETASIEIELKNVGTSRSLGLQGDLSTTNPSVTIVRGAGLRFGDVYGGATACAVAGSGPAGYCSGSSSYAPSFIVPSTVVAGTVIPFSLTLHDKFGNTFIKTFDYEVRSIAQAFAIESTTIVSDTNNDDHVSPGESGSIEIALKNVGASGARGVTADLTSSLSSVTITRGTGLRFGDISAGSAACGVAGTGSAGYCSGSSTYAPGFAVPTSVAVGTTIPFTLSIKDSYGNSFSKSFGYTVTAIDQSFAIDSTTIVSDTNHDGAVSPGETGRIEVALKNTGTSRGRDIKGTLTTTNPTVTVTGGDGLRFGDIYAGSSACGVTAGGIAGYCSGSPSYAPSFTVAPSTPAGTSIKFSLAIADAYGNTFTSSFVYVVKP